MIIDAPRQADAYVTASEGKGKEKKEPDGGGEKRGGGGKRRR